VSAPRDLESAALRQSILGANNGQVQCIFVTGGDTAMKVCAALAIERLQVQCEFAPGIPMTIAQGGPMHGTLVILKSGGFGRADLLSRLAEQFATSFQKESRMNDVRLPHVVISLGDPAGVGGEVTLKALAHPEISALADWTVLGDHPALAAAEQATGVTLSSLKVNFQDCKVLGKDDKIEYGVLRAEYGNAAARYVHDATLMCLSGEADAMVTAPLNKEAVTMSGMAFSGHTEYIAELCGGSDSRMLLAGVKLSVVHVSTHTSLRNACNLNTERIIRTIELGNEAMKLRGWAHPRIAVCGLNPHAGEHGLFGSEDAEFILPAVEACREKGIDCEGPVAPDTIFLKAAKGSHDLIVAMYHDQGHIPMKLLDFEATVNTSLGIPIIRTSVDHGTAFDIAGKNIASEGNMIAAMKMAATMAAHRILQLAKTDQETTKCAH
jgi:4-hydroxythreonine-4-phosphate dehydrogenase